jgi:hypothetical protein
VLAHRLREPRPVSPPRLIFPSAMSPPRSTAEKLVLGILEQSLELPPALEVGVCHCSSFIPHLVVESVQVPNIGLSVPGDEVHTRSSALSTGPVITQSDPLVTERFESCRSLLITPA